MRKTSFSALVDWLLCVVLALCLLLAGGCGKVASQGPPQGGQGEQPIPKTVTKEENQKVALDFLRNSPTFRFDGIQNTLKLMRSDGEEKTSRWEFYYEFQCRQAGYGDRKGMVLAQVITDHKAKIIVEQGRVVYAVLDGKWDELKQKIIN